MITPVKKFPPLTTAWSARLHKPWRAKAPAQNPLPGQKPRALEVAPSAALVFSGLMARPTSGNLLPGFQGPGAFQDLAIDLRRPRPLLGPEKMPRPLQGPLG
jgi:hypothetical protein